MPMHPSLKTQEVERFLFPMRKERTICTAELLVLVKPEGHHPSRNQEFTHTQDALSLIITFLTNNVSWFLLWD